MLTRRCQHQPSCRRCRCTALLHRLGVVSQGPPWLLVLRADLPWVKNGYSLARHITLTPQRIPGTLGAFAAVLRWHRVQIAYAQERVTWSISPRFAAAGLRSTSRFAGRTNAFCQKVLAIVGRSTRGGGGTRSCA